MKLSYWNTPRAPRPPALNKPAEAEPFMTSHRDDLQPRRNPATADGDGADTACEARATSPRERWRLPTGITERELFAMHGVVYSTTREDPR